MSRRKLPSGAPWEDIVGYSRAVAAGDLIWVTGCTSIVAGEVVHERDAYGMDRLAAIVFTRFETAGRYKWVSSAHHVPMEKDMRAVNDVATHLGG